MIAYLLDEGALLEARCKWTDMTALHYAIYFDVASAAELLLDRGADIRAICRELCRGNCLHIAATQLALDTARVLIRRGADRYFLDDRQRTPYGKSKSYLTTSHILIASTFNDSPGFKKILILFS